MKKYINIIFKILTYPVYLLYLFNKLILGSERKAFLFFSELFALFPGIAGVYLRRGFYSHTSELNGENIVISFGTVFSTPNFILEEDVYIGRYCSIGEVEIWNNTKLASFVSIVSGKHQHRRTKTGELIPGNFKKIMIGNNVWIGERAVIGKHLDDQTIVPAGEVVI